MDLLAHLPSISLIDLLGCTHITQKRILDLKKSFLKKRKNEINNCEIIAGRQLSITYKNCPNATHNSQPLTIGSGQPPPHNSTDSPRKVLTPTSPQSSPRSPFSFDTPPASPFSFSSPFSSPLFFPSPKPLAKKIKRLQKNETEPSAVKNKGDPELWSAKEFISFLSKSFQVASAKEQLAKQKKTVRRRYR